MNSSNTNIFPPLSIKVISVGTTERSSLFWFGEDVSPHNFCWAVLNC